MDFHNMKRKELQAQCKKHNIPANSTNLEMANKLASLIKEKEKPMARGRSCLKNLGEIVSENDSAGITRQSKKVRFSPENEMILFVDSEAKPVETKRGARRKSIMRPMAKKGVCVIDNVDTIETSGEITENPVRKTRSRAQKSVTQAVIPVASPAVEKKRTRNGVRSDSAEVKDGGRGDKPTPVVDFSDNLASDSAAVEETGVPTRRSLRNREVISKNSRDVKEDVALLRKNQTLRSSKKKNVKTSYEISEDNGLAADGGITQPEKALRRSQRNVRKVEDYGLLNGDLGKNEMARRRRTILSQTQLADNASAPETETRTETEVEVQGKLQVVLQLEEPSRCRGRNRNRRQSVMPQSEKMGTDGAKVENESEKLEVVLKLEEPSRCRSRNGNRRHSVMPLIEKVATEGAKAENEIGKLEVVLNLEKPSKCRGGKRQQSVMPQTEKVRTDVAKVEHESRKVLRSSVLEGGSSRQILEVNDVRSRGSSSRNRSVAISDGTDRIANNTGKNKPQKRRRDPILELSSVTEGATLVEEPPRRSAHNAAETDTAALAVGTGKAAQKKKLQSRSKLPNLEVEPLAESTLAIKEPPNLDAQLSMPEIAGTTITTVSNSRKVTSKKIKEFSEKSIAKKEVSAETSDFEEAKALKVVNSVEIPASKSVKLQNDHAAKETFFSVSGPEADKDKPLQDDISNGEKSAFHSCKRSREFDSKNFVEVETEEDWRASTDVDVLQATPADDGYSPVDQTDYVAKAYNLDLGKEMKRDEEPTTCKYISSSCAVAHHGTDDDRASVLKEPNLVELEGSDSLGEPIKPELFAEDHVADSNESRCSEKNFEKLYEEAGEISFVDLSDKERIRPTKITDRETDEAEKSAVGTEGQESANCGLRMQNIEKEALLTEDILAFKGPIITDPGLSELEIADGANPSLTRNVKVSQGTSLKRKGSSRCSSLKKHHHLIEACTKSTDFDEIRGLMMVNLEGTPVSHSVKLQSDSAELKGQIPISESLVGAERENLVLVAGNQNLFQDDVHKGTVFYLAMRPQTRSGEFDRKTLVDLEPVEDQDIVRNVVITETTDGFVHQAEYVGKPSTILNLSGDLETEHSVSSKFSHSRGVTVGDYAAGDDKCSVLEVQNFVEFQELGRFAETSTHERLCEGHSTGPDESEGAGEDCENDSEKAVDFMSALDPSHGERVTPQRTPLVAPQCQASPIGDQMRHSAGPAYSIVNDRRQGNAIEGEENSKCNTEFHHGIMKAADMFASDTEDKICSQEKIEEALAEMENKPEGVLSVERILHPVDKEPGYECVQANSSLDGCFFSISNKLNGQLKKEKDNAGSGTDSVHCSEKIKEASLSRFTDGKRILISLERDTGKAEETSAPIITPESSLVFKKEIMSSSAHTPLKDDNETAQENELKTLFATPDNNTNPTEAASNHESDLDDVTMQEDSTISNMENGRLNHEEPQEVDGLTENEDEKVVYKANAPPTSSEEVNGEGGGSSAVEFAGMNDSSYTGSDRIISKDGNVGHDKESEGLKFHGNASKEGTNVEVHELIAGAGIAPSTSETDADKTEYSKEAAEGNEYSAESHVVGVDTDCKCSEVTIPHTVRCAPEYQASGTGNKGMSSSEFNHSVDSEMQDKVIHSTIVTEAKNDGKSIEVALHLARGKLAIEEKNVEFWHPSDCNDLVAQVSGRSDAHLAETPCKESKVSEEAELIKSTSKCIDGINLLNEEENGGILASVGQLGISKMVLDNGDDFAVKNANAPDASDVLSDKVAKENVIFPVTEADVDYKDSDVAPMEDTNSVMLEHEHNDSGTDKDEMVAELDKSTSIAIDKLTNKKEDEDLVEVSNKFEGAVLQVDEEKFNDRADHKIQMVQELNKVAFLPSHEFISADNEHGGDETAVDVVGTKLQVKEMKLDDLDSHKAVGIMEGNLNIIDKNSYAEDDVSLGYFDNCSEHEKVLKQASCSLLNVSDCDGQDSESHVHQVDLSSDAERREVTEIDQVNVFDDHGFTVSSLVSIDCNEDGGDNPPMDKSFQEDKAVAKEKVVGDMMDKVSSDSTDGSYVEENVSTQKISKEQLLGNEHALEEDAFVGSIGGLALNKPLCGNETKSKAGEVDAVHGSLHNFNDMVHCAGDSNEYAEQQNFSQASTSKPATNDDCAAISSFGLAAYNGTMGHGASEPSLESNMFSNWEINLFSGDEFMKSNSGFSETNFTCEDNAVASVMKENVNVIFAEEHLGKHNHLIEGKVAEPNDSCFVSDESIFEGDEFLEERDLDKKSNDSRYSEGELLEAKKSSVSIHEVILTEVFNLEGGELAASVELRGEGGSKSSEREGIAKTSERYKCEERAEEATELSEHVSKPSSIMEDQSSQFTDLAVDGGSAAEDAQMWRPNSELVKVKNPLAKAGEGNSAMKLLNSTTMKKKNARTSSIRGTPRKLLTTLDMKENALSIKREHLGSTAVKSTTKRRALEDLHNK